MSKEAKEYKVLKLAFSVPLERPSSEPPKSLTYILGMPAPIWFGVEDSLEVNFEENWVIEKPNIEIDAEELAKKMKEYLRTGHTDDLSLAQSVFLALVKDVEVVTRMVREEDVIEPMVGRINMYLGFSCKKENEGKVVEFLEGQRAKYGLKNTFAYFFRLLHENYHDNNPEWMRYGVNAKVQEGQENQFLLDLFQNQHISFSSISINDFERKSYKRKFFDSAA